MHKKTNRAKKDVKSILLNIDFNHSGDIDYNGMLLFLNKIIIEFLIANMKVKLVLKEEKLKEAFNFYDEVTRCQLFIYLFRIKMGLLLWMN